MSETVKNKHVKKKNSAVLLLKTVITAVLLFFTWYLCSHFMEYQKNATNQVNKYRIDQICCKPEVCCKTYTFKNGKSLFWQ